jgi:ABC-type multidrug transport system fused ATPase/permease subunit
LSLVSKSSSFCLLELSLWRFYAVILIFFLNYLFYQNNSKLILNKLRALGASQRIFELLDTQSEIPLDSGFKPANETDDAKSFDGSVILNKVDFSYPTRPEAKVINDISFKIEKGCTFALVGPSGGGKSTVKFLVDLFAERNFSSF